MTKTHLFMYTEIFGVVKIEDFQVIFEISHFSFLSLKQKNCMQVRAASTSTYNLCFKNGKRKLYLSSPEI